MIRNTARMWRRFAGGALPVLAAWGMAAFPSALCGAAFPPEDIEFFEARIRPLLAEHCTRCHSRDEGKQKGGLYLDTRDDLLRGGDTRPAIVPGDPASSLLIEAVHYGNPDLQMPPKTRLDPGVVARLEEWIRRGAPWPDAPVAAAAVAAGGFDLETRRQEHWAWKAPVAVPVPEDGEEGGASSPVDRFLQRRLVEAGLTPSPEADRPTLLRRVTFDLIGLPPTAGELAAFLADGSPRSLERVVDRLLASPHFGEKWGRHWLDLVRWAESRGHEFDPDIPNAWRYRDYVVRALNRDLPYDQFLREHLAGDLIPPRTDPETGANESVLATGFWFLGEEVHSPVDIRQDEADRLDNRLDVMGKAFLGLTVSCARCHDHKFDAISQRDYYGLSGFLISSGYRQVRYETVEKEAACAAALEAWRAAVAPRVVSAYGRALDRGWAALEDRIPEALARGEGDAEGDWGRMLAAARKDPLDPWHPVAMRGEGNPNPAGAGIPSPDAWVLDFGAATEPGWHQDGSVFGTRARRAGEPLWRDDPRRPLAGVSPWPAAWRDPAWPQLETIESERDTGRLGTWNRSGQTLRTRDFELQGGRLWYLVRGAGRAYAVVNSHLIVHGPLHGALLREWDAPESGWTWIEHRLEDYPGHRLHVELSPRDTTDFAVAAVVQSAVRPPLPPPAGAARPSVVGPEAFRAVVRELRRVARFMATEGRIPDGDPADPPRADWMVRHVDLLCPPDGDAGRELDHALAEVTARHRELVAAIPKASRTAPAILEGPGIDGRVLKRGSPRLPGDRAPRRFLEAIDGPEQEPFHHGSGRLELAERVTDPGNPLTGRVAVNRVWHHLFGRGLVASTDNLGVLGERPTHPELLDHLAVRFTGELGWSLKRLIRELVLTRAYRQSSAPADALAEMRDPDNRLLHRMNVRRLDAEAVRDALLAVSGRLDPSVGGPSVPVHLTSFMEGRGRPETSGPADGAGRRSLYLELRRNFLPPFLLAFDMPIPFSSVGRRNISNVPSQALILMNDPVVIDLAAQWAGRLPVEASPRERIVSMFLSAFAREPSGEEIAAALEFVDDASPGGSDPKDPRHGTWADLAHVLFNVKEFIYLN